MYLTEEEIRVLLQRIGARFPAYTLIFDAYSRLTARQAGRHPSLKKTGAKISWGVDDPGELTKWEAGIRFVGERYFTSYEGVRSLDLGTRILFGAAGLIPMARKAHRILIYEISRTD